MPNRSAFWIRAWPTNSPSASPTAACSRIGSPSSVDFSPHEMLIRDEHVFLGELLEQRGRFAEVRGQHVERVPGNPLRQVDRLVDAGIQSDENATGLAADVLNRVPISLGNIADVPLFQFLDSIAAVRTEHRHADVPLDNVLPFVGVGVPM